MKTILSLTKYPSCDRMELAINNELCYGCCHDSSISISSLHRRCAMRAIAFVMVLTVILLSTEALAEVPGLINYQGTLIDEYGVVLDTTIEMTFSIYTDSTGGTQVWTETQSAVTVSSGLFNVLLGRVNAIEDTVFSGPERWLGVQAGGDAELSPRQRIGSVGYAFMAGSGGGSSDGDWTIDGDNLYRLVGNVGIGRDDALTKLDIVGNTRVRGNLYVDQLDSTESVLDIYNYDVSDWELVAASDADRFDIREYGGSPSLSVEAGGNVGIGTTNPLTKLDVQGTLNVGEDDTGYDVNCYGRDSGSRLFWDEDKMALRAGRDFDGTHWAPDSVGYYSLATGAETKASGWYSTAMGIYSTASGNNSSAMGCNTTASGDYSTATGYNTTASGIASTARGEGTIASGDYSTAMGHVTQAGGLLSVAIGKWVAAAADTSMVLGSGRSYVESLVNDIDNSLMIAFKDTTATLFVGGPNHRVGIGTTSPSAKLDIQGTLNVGENGAGYDVNCYGKFSRSRLFWDESKMALRAGRDFDGTHWAPDSVGEYSLASGFNTKATGLMSTAMGYTTTASGDYSTATGTYTIASGLYSTAMGEHSTASGHLSTAMGYYSTAGGYASTSIGRYVTADSTNAIVLGKGLSNDDRLINSISNSLMVGFNDTTATLFVGGIDHRVGIRTDSPTAKLDVNGDMGYDQFRLRTTYTPTGTADANGATGDMAWDDNYVYIKTSAGWKRAALSTF